MIIKRVEFQNFRSFGNQLTAIDFEDLITFFVGKNHTGKSNLSQFFKEIIKSNLPISSSQLLSRGNWFNNEIGIDRPLKLKISLKLNEVELEEIYRAWFYISIQEIISILSEIQDKQKENELKRQILSKYSWKKVKTLFLNNNSENLCYLRIEFIQFSDITQQINYSFQFSEFMAVNTADGRCFFQNLQTKSDKMIKEKQLWDDFIWNYFKQNWNTIKQNIKSLSVTNFFNYLVQSKEKFIFPNESLDNIVQKFLNLMDIVENNVILNSEYLNFNSDQKSSENKENTFLARKLDNLRQLALKDPKYWQKYSDLQHHFQAMYENLDLVFGIDISNENRIIKFYQTKENMVILNFDSIGTGIIQMLHFLYLLIVESNRIILIDNPEYQLHPHSQRNLYNLIKDYSVRNNHQIILTTHSLFFLQPDDIFNLRLFDLFDGVTNISQVIIPINLQELYKIKRNFSVHNRDAIFADGLVFVEGPSEEMAFPYFFRIFGLDLDLNNLSLINLNGKGSFAIFWQFAHQLHKKFWFFFDNDALGVKSRENITPSLFKRSIINKNRHLFPPDIIQLCNELSVDNYESTIEFHENLELLRNLLQNYHIFIFNEDFEGIFEEYLLNRISFFGGKVEKSMQLVEYLQLHSDVENIPDAIYPYIEIIRDELKEKNMGLPT